MTQRVNNCELCCDVLSKELPCFDVSQDKSMKIIIGFIVPYLDISTLEKFVICTNCCRCLQQLEQIWVSYSETEKQIRLFKQVRAEVGVPNENPLTLGDLLTFHRDGEVRINIENQLYCRLCLQWVPEIGYEFNSDSVHYVMLKSISRCWDFASTIDPIICDICQKTIEEVYSFREKCLNARNPMKFQPEGMSDGEDFDIDDEDDHGREFSKIEINENDIKMQVVNINSASHAYSCMYCSYVTPVQAYFKRHSRTKHRGQDSDVIIIENEPFSCNMCSFKTRVPSDLKIHIRKAHGGPASNRSPRDQAPTIVAQVPEESIQSTVPPENEIVLRRSLRLSLRNSKANCTDNNDRSRESAYKKGTEIKDVDDTSVPCRHLKTNRFGNMFECIYACKKSSEVTKNTKKYNSETFSRECSLVDQRKSKRNKRNSKENETTKENQLRKQTKAKNYQIIYKCIRCPLETIYKSNLKRHLIRVHNESLDFAVSVCDSLHMPKSSPKKKTISNQKHIDIKNGENDKRSHKNVEKSGTKQLKRRDQVAHDKSHQKVVKESSRNNGKIGNGDTKSRQTRGGKKAAVSKKNNVRISQELHKSTESRNKVKPNGFKKPIYQCSVCPYITERRRTLTNHEAALHSENAPLYDCSPCNFKSKWESALMKHKKSKTHLNNVKLISR